MNNLIYFLALIFFFVISFKVFSSIHIENEFNKNKVFEIKAAYVLLSLAVAHLLADMILKISGTFESFFK
ncbi:MAG: DUF1146 family protein [Acholeplasmatales bacterium]|jgi:uncharacterized membrane protein YwzB|nr:DUF1146 family protein [Acholeplasmatales bacterium]